MGTSLVVHSLRIRLPNAGDEGSIPSRGTKSSRAWGQIEKPQLVSFCTTTREAPVCCNEDPHYMDGGDAQTPK